MRLAMVVERLERPTRDALSLVGLGVVLILLLNPSSHGSDAYAYWSFDISDPYARALGPLDSPAAFRYGPPIAFLFLPFHAMPWWFFITLWTLLLVAAVIWLTRRWGLAWLAIYPVILEVSYGNVSLLLAIAIVLGFRWPASWAFVLLTKVTPGVALFWFVFRREWRNLLIAIGATAAIGVVSALLVPDLWRRWLGVLAASATLPDPGAFGFVPRELRFIGAVGLVAWGAATNRRWTVPISAGLAAPVAWWFAPVMLGAIPLVPRRQPGVNGKQGELRPAG